MKYSVLFLLRIVKHVLLSPAYLWKAVSHSMTGASTTLIVMIIISMNIIWGYPWLGLFAACSSLLIVGLVINRLTKPKLSVEVTVPDYVQAGDQFGVDVRVKNEGRIPAMDLNVGFHREYRLLKTFAPREYIRRILPDEHSLSPHKMRFATRGVHELPKVYVESLFPFSLFRAIARYDSNASVPVVPKPLSENEFEATNATLRKAVGDIVRKASGDMLEYSGSREYQSGMTVRRWDFASWARLGRPIVREFSSQSQVAVTLIVDTSFEYVVEHETRRGKQTRMWKQAKQLERLLSLTATVLEKFSSGSVQTTMLVTSEDPEATDDVAANTSQALLIRLASAVEVDSSIADERMSRLSENAINSAVILLTCRDPKKVTKQLPRNVAGFQCLSAEGKQHEGPTSATAPIRPPSRHPTPHSARSREQEFAS